MHKRRARTRVTTLIRVCFRIHLSRIMTMRFPVTGEARSHLLDVPARFQLTARGWVITVLHYRLTPAGGSLWMNIGPFFPSSHLILWSELYHNPGLLSRALAICVSAKYFSLRFANYVDCDHMKAHRGNNRLFSWFTGKTKLSRHFIKKLQFVTAADSLRHKSRKRLYKSPHEPYC